MIQDGPEPFDVRVREARAARSASCGGSGPWRPSPTMPTTRRRPSGSSRCFWRRGAEQPGGALEAAAVSEGEKKSAKQRLAELRELLHQLRVPRWAYPIVIVTFSLIFVAALWLSHLPSYLESYPVRWWLVLAATVAISFQFVGYALALWAAASRPLRFGELSALELGESVTAMVTPRGSAASPCRCATSLSRASAPPKPAPPPVCRASSPR